MKYLLDTNVISELRKPASRVDPAVAAWARVQRPSSLYLSVVTAQEIEIGIQRVERRDELQAKHLRQWLDEVLDTFARRILPVDLEIALCAATMHVPDPRPDRDAYLAATAKVHRLTVATRNIADFAPTGVPIVNPWSPHRT